MLFRSTIFGNTGIFNGEIDISGNNKVNFGYNITNKIGAYINYNSTDTMLEIYGAGSFSDGKRMTLYDTVHINSRLYIKGNINPTQSDGQITLHNVDTNSAKLKISSGYKNSVATANYATYLLDNNVGTHFFTPNLEVDKQLIVGLNGITTSGNIFASTGKIGRAHV